MGILIISNRSNVMNLAMMLIVLMLAVLTALKLIMRLDSQLQDSSFQLRRRLRGGRGQ